MVESYFYHVLSIVQGIVVLPIVLMLFHRSHGSEESLTLLENYKLFYHAVFVVFLMNKTKTEWKIYSKEELDILDPYIDSFKMLFVGIFFVILLASIGVCLSPSIALFLVSFLLILRAVALYKDLNTEL